MRYFNKDGTQQFVITSKEARDFYFLYKSSGKLFEKLGRAKSPVDLEGKFGVSKNLGV
jgi:hypothetical protein